MNNLVPSKLEKSNVDIGYLRLTDAAPYIVAQELGIFAQFGLAVSLHQEVSWANVRDKVVSGSLDAAQMLAPLPAMTTFGASGLRAHLIAGLVTSKYGNAITLREDLLSLAQQTNAATLGHGLRDLTRRRPITFGTVHPFSSHTLLIRRWLKSLAIDPDRDVKILVVPPSQMVDSLQQGVIDGYCVGEPWNTVGQLGGAGKVVALGSNIWPNAPEKVLAVSAQWHAAHPQTHLSLRRALLRACRWLSEPGHSEEAAELLAQPEYLNMPKAYLLPSLCGGGSKPLQEVHQFYGPNLNRPEPGTISQMIHECAELLGKNIDADTVLTLTNRSYLPQLYDSAANFAHA